MRLWADDEDPRASMVQDIDFALDWQPARAALGVSWNESHWDFSIDGVYLRWSDYVDHHNQAPVSKFEDIIDVGMHGALRLNEWFGNAGLRYSPSPVPRQTGRENYADSDRYIGGFAGGRSVSLAGERVEIAVGVQFSALASRTETKQVLESNGVIDEFPDSIDLSGDPLPESQGLQTKNPGWPGYRGSGWLWASTLTLTWRR